MTDFTQFIEPVARRLLGEPNAGLSSAAQLRFGTHGSIAVEISGDKAGTWFDHENQRGGGVLDLIRTFGNISNGKAVEWLKDEIGIALPGAAKSRLVAAYDYVDVDGALLFQVCRYEPKTFNQRRPDERSGWIWNTKEIEPVPYRLPELVAACGKRWIVIAEGEKDIDNLRGLGFASTCNPGGAGKWPDAFAQYFAGASVAILPDNDAAGRRHALDVAAKLHGTARRVRLVELPGLPDKGDVSDWIKAGGDADTLRAIIDRIPDWSPEAAPKADGASSVDRPVIRIAADDLFEMVNQTEAALIKAGLPILARGGRLVRPVTEHMPAANGKNTHTAKLRSLLCEEIVDAMAEAIRFERFDGRSRQWIAAWPPEDVARILMARDGRWSFPSVVGVITTPTIRRDGSLLLEAGYDPATRLYHACDTGLVLPAMESTPTKAEAERALALLKEVLEGFPFVDAIDRSVALSGLLTAVGRGAIATSPMHAISANTAGSGKSYLVDLISTVATGQACPVITAGKTEDETEKRLGALLLAGTAIISIDNVNGELGGDMLCQIVERPVVRTRILGQSKVPEVEVRSTCFATGNNLLLRGDMTRRALLCTLDAEMERPELRQFVFDPIARVMADRGAYVAAGLTICRAYIVAGRPGRLPPLGSYTDWSDLIRSALVWLGEQDPVASMERAREEDPVLVEIREIFGQWEDCLSLGTKYTARAIISRAEDNFGNGDYRHPDLRDALMKIAGTGGRLSSKSLGKWLARTSRRIVGGKRLTVIKDDKHGHQYALEIVEEILAPS